MNIQLSGRQKHDYLPDIISNDGFVCLYDGESLVGRKWIYEHLDDNPTNNVRENIAIACQSCNNKKPHNSTMKQIALRKKEKNEKNNYTRAGASEVSPPSLKPEIDISQTNFELTFQYLSEIISSDNFIEFKSAVDCCVMSCKKNTGTGSHTAIRRYVDALVSKEGPFMVTQNDKKEKMIVRRNGN